MYSISLCPFGRDLLDTCAGAGYSDPYRTWDSVVVQGTIKIRLTDYKSQAKLNNNHVNLHSGTVCSLSIGNCLDIEGGYIFWEIIPTDSCKFNKYGVLYEGFANKMLNSDLGSHKQIVYSLQPFQTYTIQIYMAMIKMLQFKNFSSI